MLMRLTPVATPLVASTVATAGAFSQDLGFFSLFYLVYWVFNKYMGFV